MQNIDPSSSANTVSGAPAQAQAATPATSSTLLDSAVRSVHDSVDRLAAKAAPALEQLVGGAHSAADAA